MTLLPLGKSYSLIYTTITVALSILITAYSLLVLCHAISSTNSQTETQIHGMNQHHETLQNTAPNTPHTFLHTYTRNSSPAHDRNKNKNLQTHASDPNRPSFPISEPKNLDFQFSPISSSDFDVLLRSAALRFNSITFLIARFSFAEENIHIRRDN